MTKFLFAVLICSFAQAQHQHHDHGTDGDRNAVHGMIVTGSSKIYVSHLPLFSSPHDYQVIMEVEFDKASKEKYLESLGKLGTEDDANAYHTLEPEAFKLPEMVKEPREFSARLVRGHFEREGHTDVEMNVTVNIVKVLYFKKFDKSAKRDERSQWLLFGNKDEQFAAHLISAQPDFDQILAGSVIGSLAKRIEKEGALAVTSELVNTPMVPSQLEKGNLNLSLEGKDVSFSKITQIYLETQELE